ncbi:MAG: BON domain-containing protein, partial [Phycisphaerae bacterium]
MTKDKELTGRIQQAMLDDDRLSGQPIELTTRKGVVTLRGTVQSHRRKLAAQEIAASFGGCRDVINELTVEPTSAVPDEEVANNVRAALDAHADVTQEVITVSASNGTVTLNGNIASEWERTVAEDVAMSARGVRSVQNLLVVDLVREIEDQALSHNIREALKWARGLRDIDIHVAVTGDTAVLSGEVQQLWQKEAAAVVTRRFRIHTLRNDITV